MCLNPEHAKCVTWRVQMVERLWFYIVSIDEHKYLNYLSLGKFDKLAKFTKRISEKRKCPGSIALGVKDLYSCLSFLMHLF